MRETSVTKVGMTQFAMTGPIRKIVFTGDVLRPSAGGLRPTQHENIAWLAKLLGTPLSLATGLPSEVVNWDNNWLNGAPLDEGTVRAIYEAFWLKPGLEAWPQVFAAKTLPPMVEDLFLRLFKGSFVVGFELPPYLTAFCGRHGIGFIDCSLSPVRFMDDLLFELSSNSPAITEALRPHAVPEALIRLQAGVLSAAVAKIFPDPPRPRSLLVMLQTSFDKVVMRDGRFVTLLDHFDALQAVARDYDHVLVRAHPMESRQDVLEAVLKRLPDARETGENFYRLVSHHNVEGVTALSSSCVHEAGFFGKRGHYLLPGFHAGTFTPGLAGVTIGDEVLRPDFWREVLAVTPCPVTAPDGLRLAAKPNRFRQQLRAAWGYNEIDTDIFVQWARA